MGRKQQYKEYLSSQEWRDQRELALARTSGFCQFCGDVATQVHHVRYPKQFGSEHPHSLVPVCQRCHDGSHGVQKMKALADVTVTSEISPKGVSFRYLLSGGRVYASAQSWERALQVPRCMSEWFTSGLSRVAMLKKDLAGGELEMSYLGRAVYRWHAVAEQLRVFDRSWYQHAYKSRSADERAEIDKFHENFERLTSWGYDLQERALANAVNGQIDSGPGVSQEMLIEVMKQAVAPRLQGHDDKIREHDVVIEEIKEAVPALRDEEEFITVKQAITEQGLDWSQMPLSNSRENLSGLAGQLLKSHHADQGPQVPARLDGTSIVKLMNTFRRGAIYRALTEIIKGRPQALPLAPRD
jgi:hypothetical protein